MNISYWRNVDFATLEHIAPVKKPLTGWSDKLYQEAYLVNSIGNLTLLPEKENSSIGNSSWEKKRLFYKAVSAESKEQLNIAKAAAKKSGVDFGKKTIAALEKGNCLPIVKAISNTNDWTNDIIKQRTENIAKLCWFELSGWIELESE